MDVVLISLLSNIRRLRILLDWIRRSQSKTSISSIAPSAITYDVMAEIGKVLHFRYAGVRTGSFVYIIIL